MGVKVIGGQMAIPVEGEKRIGETKQAENKNVDTIDKQTDLDLLFKPVIDKLEAVEKQLKSKTQVKKNKNDCQFIKQFTDQLTDIEYKLDSIYKENAQIIVFQDSITQKIYELENSLEQIEINLNNIDCDKVLKHIQALATELLKNLNSFIVENKELSAHSIDEIKFLKHDIIEEMKRFRDDVDTNFMLSIKKFQDDINYLKQSQVQIINQLNQISEKCSNKLTHYAVLFMFAVAGGLIGAFAVSLF